MSDKRISRWGQVRIYTGKCFRLFVAERQWTNFISSALIMFIISLVTGDEMFVSYAETKNGAFAIICACVWIGLFNSIQSICRERAIIKREHRTGLHISSYILAHVIYELAVCAVEALIVVVIVYVRNHSNFPESGLILLSFLDLYLTFLLVIFGSDMIAVLISCIVKNETAAMTVMPFVLIIQLVMSGAVFPLDGLTETISHFTLSKWGLNAVCALANTVDSVETGYNFSGQTGCDATAKNLAVLWLFLAAFAVIYIILGVLALKQVDRDQR